MIPANETFANTWPFKPHFSTAPGFAMHYVDEGTGEPIVLLHGEPTWGYVYRKFIPPLAATNRVIVPDHMGFGKSATPQDRIYTLQTHVENLEALFDDLRLTNITFVMQDWGGPIGAAYTLRHPERVRRLVLMNTTIGYGTIGRRDLPNPLTASPWLRWVQEGTRSGQFNEVMRNLGTSVLSVMHIIGFRNFSIVNDVFVNAYASPFLTPRECLGAIQFPLDLVQNRIRDFVIKGLPIVPALREKPALMIEGTADTAIPPELALADFRGLWPEGEIVEMPNAGHYCQEDEPELIVSKIKQFVTAV